MKDFCDSSITFTILVTKYVSFTICAGSFVSTGDELECLSNEFNKVF